MDAKFWKFLLVGVINTLVGTAIMFGLYNLAHVGYWLSSAANYILTSILSYFLNKYFTFRNTEKGWKPIFRFAVNIGVCYLLAYGIAEPLMRWALSSATETLRENAAMLTGMCLFTGFNYLGQRLFAFREKKD
ncbi:MAG: GtrA family protein [Clostridia bacterium]|nr:GtrA family protein [Clostridia bacterium]